MQKPEMDFKERKKRQEMTHKSAYIKLVICILHSHLLEIAPIHNVFRKSKKSVENSCEYFVKCYSERNMD